MNLYLISQTENNDYDTYDSAVVAASTEEEARHVCPSDYHKWIEGEWNFVYSDGTHRPDNPSSWVQPSSITVKLIGRAADDVVAGVVCASYNAG